MSRALYALYKNGAFIYAINVKKNFSRPCQEPCRSNLYILIIRFIAVVIAKCSLIGVRVNVFLLFVFFFLITRYGTNLFPSKRH